MASFWQRDFWQHGFLGFRGSFMLDFVCVAMLVVLPLMGLSIVLARKRQGYTIHKRIQLALGIVLAVAVCAFEIDLRFVTDWRQRSGASPYFSSDGWSLVWSVLVVHLFCSVPTAGLWIFVLVQSLRNFPRPPAPCEYSRCHIFWARLAAIGMAMTAMTGWLFYWLAFVAE